VSATLRIELETEPFERARAEVAVAGFFETDRPLRGAASRADWRLCGMLSRLVAGGWLSGAADEALLVPTGTRLRAPRLLVVGLGRPSPFGAAEVSRAAASMLGHALDLGLESVALAIPGEWIGAVPIRPGAEACTRGAIEALAERDRDACLRLLVPEAACGRALRGLEAARSRARATGIELELPDLERTPGEPVRPSVGAASPRSPISPSAGRP
jgi:hypothetical protein